MATLFAFVPTMHTHFKGQTYYKVNYVVLQSLQIWTKPKVGFLGRYIPWECDLTKHPLGVTSFETLSSVMHATSVVSC
jgi:hypothetical protein